MRILGYVVAAILFPCIGYATDVDSEARSAQLEQQPLHEVTIMVLFGLALLGVSAIIRWRMRAKDFAGEGKVFPTVRKSKC